MSLYKDSEASLIGITAAFAFLAIIDLIGNSLVCLIVFRNRTMRIAMNYLLVNLAVADMAVAVFIAIRYIFSLVFTYPEGRAGDLICGLLMNSWTGALASAYSLVCIALERYLAVKFPYDKQKRITTAKLKYIVVVVWVFAVSWNMPLFLYARYDPVDEYCTFNYPIANFIQFHSPACFVVYGVLPMSIMIYLYSKLVYTLWFRPILSSTMAQQSKLRHIKKSARMVVTVSVIYGVCWMPHLIIYVISSFSSLRIYSSVFTTSVVLVSLNSAINPVLYSLQSNRFRKHMLALLPFSRCSRRRGSIVPVKLVKPTGPNETASAREILLPLESRGPIG